MVDAVLFGIGLLIVLLMPPFKAHLSPDVGQMLHYAVPGEVAEAIEEAGGVVAAKHRPAQGRAQRWLTGSLRSPSKA
jgi:hypothetical protein